MKITFLGADHEVTGSLTLVELNDEKLLVDCGMEQGKDIFVNQQLPVSASEINCVLLTHAHIDHSGNLPLLYKNGFRGKVYATTATCSLANIMLRDSAHIQESEAEWQNRKNKRADDEEYKPIYTMEDAEGLISCLRPVDYGERIRILDGVEIRFVDIGHLLGSAAIETWLTEGNTTKKFVFSGDIGNINKPLLNDPKTIEDADYVMIESTYGDRLHERVECDYVGMISEVIQTTLDRGGNVIIPSFAVGRTQEILYLIRLAKHEGRIKGHDAFRVIVDSPLANEATSIFLQADAALFDDESSALIRKGVNPLWFEGLESTISSEESKQLNFDMEPKVIISASGMCEAGRIRHHLKHNLWRPESTILFVGYQTGGTLGRAILDGVESVKLFGERIAVKAKIRELHGSSGHADMNGLVEWLTGFKNKPKMVFVNHGEDSVCTSFANMLENEYGYNICAPHSGTVYDLIVEEFITETEGVAISKDERASAKATGRDKEAQRRSNRAYNDLVRAAEQLTALAKGSRDIANDDKQRLMKDIESILARWK